MTTDRNSPTTAARLGNEHVQRLKAVLPLWRTDMERGGTISRDFKFGSFMEAFGFMTQVALVAERLDHHPEWVNVHTRVSITLTTHDVQGLSTKDIELARAADRVYASISEHLHSSREG